MSKNDSTSALLRRKSLARLIIAASDIRKAISASKQFKNNIKSTRHPLFETLQEATIIAYSRPFTANEGYGQLPSKYYKYQLKKHRQLHREVLTRRNRFVAHSDGDVRDVLIFSKGSLISPNIDSSSGNGYLIDNVHYDVNTMNLLHEMSTILLDKLQADILLELDILFESIKLNGLYELTSLSKRYEL